VQIQRYYHVIRNASKNKIKSVILETLQDNKIAQNLYKKMLFKPQRSVKAILPKANGFG
jgi:ribosomal protein S18 acetylase RimI-like enzyme